jgi:ABC-type multidrug transport system ATPase subunit
MAHPTLASPAAEHTAAPAPAAAHVTPNAAHPALTVRSLTKRFQAGVHGCSATIDALRGVDLDVAPGDVVGLLGPHGAGKSTLLLCAAGLLRPDAGAVVWFGRDQAPAPRPPGIAHVPERSSYYAFLTAREAVEYYATLHELAGADRGERVERAIDRVGLGDQAGRRVSLLTRGGQQRLALAQALLGEPRLLLLDEIFSGVDGLTRRDILTLLREVAGEGCAVLLASTDAAVMYQAAGRIILLDRGMVRAAFETHGLAARGRRWLEIEVTDARAALRSLATRLPAIADGDARIRIPLDAASPEEALAVCRMIGLAVLGSRIAGDEISALDHAWRRARVAERAR